MLTSNQVLDGITLGGQLGGWTLVNQPANMLPQELASGFQIAQEEYVGGKIEPLYYVGKQMVNGTNHLFIAELTQFIGKVYKHIVAVIVNVPLNSIGGKGTKIVRIIDSHSPEVAPELCALIAAGTKDLLGTTHKPLIFIGEQVVKGVNYYIITESKVNRPDEYPYAGIATINIFNGEVTTRVQSLLQEKA